MMASRSREVDDDEGLGAGAVDDGEAWNEGAQITVNSGTCRFSGPRLRIFMNMLRANRLCHAFSVMIRMGRRYSGSAPA